MIARHAEIPAYADERQQQGRGDDHDGAEQQPQEQRRVDDDEHVAHLELRHPVRGGKTADDHDAHSGHDHGRARDPLVVPLQLGDHRGRENQDERRAGDAEAQEIDRLQNGVR